MRRCLELASIGLPLAMPNPSVGAVLVFQDTIIGEGFTSPYGGSHGEVNCINSVTENNKQYISQSTLYVSLEPCSHTGKTPPCSNLIIENKIPEVIIGCVDTFSLVAGKGIEMLQNKGVKTTVGILENECRELNKRFFTFHEKKRPFVILKWAQTSDKFIAPEKKKHGQERWITGELTKELVHKMRSEEMGILVGKNTVLVDNPSLTTRNYPGKNPTRIILDNKLQLWNSRSDFSVFNKDSKTLIVNSISNFEEDNFQGIKVEFDSNLIENLMTKLHQENLQSIIVEGGEITIDSFIKEGIWDEAFVFENEKKFKKGVKAPTLNLEANKVLSIGNDSLSIYKNYEM